MNFIALLLAATLSAGNAEFDRVAVDGAAAIAVRQAASDLAERGVATGGTLSRAMLDDPASCRTRAEAETRCRAIYGEAVSNAFLAAVGKIRSRLSLGEDFAPTLSTNDLERAGKAFAAAFDAERRDACRLQAEKLVGEVRPTIEEVDGGDEAALRTTMTGRIAASQSKPVFEENLDYISEKIVVPMLEDARKEKRRQQEYVRRTRSDAYAPSVLTADIRRRLEDNVRERNAKAQADGPAYGWEVFPSVAETTVRNTVEKRITDRFAAKVEEAPLEVKSDEVIASMAADRGAHRLKAESERVFRTRAMARVLATGLSASVGDAPAAERPELEAALKERMAAQAVARAAEKRVDAAMMPVWREARRKAVADEYEKTWPTLSDRTWFPDAETADDVAARSDYAAAVAGWRKLPALGDLSREDGVFEETDRLAGDGVKAAFDLARVAIAAQLKIVDDVHPAVLAESKARKDGLFTRTPDLKKIVEMLTAATEEKWAASRLETLWPAGDAPSNAEVQHAALFPSVRKRIELVAKSILEEMEKPEPEEKPEETPPEPPEETDSDSDSDNPEELMKISIIVERKGDEVTVKLESGKTTIAERSAKARMGDFREAMKYVSDKLGNDILRLK